MIQVRVTLLGDGAVGKTCTRKTFMGESFKTNYLPTIGADFSHKSYTVLDKEIKFIIWDLAGQPRFTEIRSMYYAGSIGSFIVYDCTNRSTFDNVKNWADELWKHCGEGRVPIVLLGNKFDLVDEFPDVVEKQEGLELAKELSEVHPDINCKVEFFQSSAKTGLNIEKAFRTLGENAINFILEKR
ncbi:MAG: GTP-binding protein [Candidatus Hodarchaeota archaeon]